MLEILKESITRIVLLEYVSRFYIQVQRQI